MQTIALNPSPQMNYTVRKADVWPIVQQAFPDYSGRKFRLEAMETITLYNTNWDGGSRNQYAAVTLADGKSSLYNAPSPWVNKAEGARVEIPFGVVIIKHCIFCGKDAGITVYVNPADMPKLLYGGKETERT